MLASLATIIASQAVISGAFSYTRQAVQLGYLPRLEVRHTSESEIGQVYVPRINYILLIADHHRRTRSSSRPTISGPPTASRSAATWRSRRCWPFCTCAARDGSLAASVPLFAAFAILDLTFLTANMLKFAQGGWFPIIVAIIVFSIMGTWWRGRRIMAELRARDALPLDEFVETLNPQRPVRVPGTAIFMTRDLVHVPAALLHAMKHYKALHERVIMMQVETIDVPHVSDERRLEIAEIGKGFHTMRVRYGFWTSRTSCAPGAGAGAALPHQSDGDLVFYRPREAAPAASPHAGSGAGATGCSSVVSNLSLDATEFFRIPPNRVVELGGQIEI